MTTRQPGGFCTGARIGLCLALSNAFAAAQNGGIDWAVHVGGAGDEVCWSTRGVCALDDGSSFVVGSTTTQPTAGAQDALVAHLSPAGAVLWTVTLGGNRDDWANAVCHDPVTGRVVIAGATSSADFPVTTSTATQASLAPGLDAFVAVLDAKGGALRYATFLGGGGDDDASDVHTDRTGSIWVHGKTTSSDFPTTANAWATAAPGPPDLFVTHFDPNIAGRAAMRYSTYLGSAGSEPALTPSDLHVDARGVVTVLAETDSNAFPTTANAFQRQFSGGATDVVLCQLDPSLPPASQLVWSTYFGGTLLENGNALAEHNGVLWITGHTRSADLPVTAGAPQPLLASVYDAFVFGLDPRRAGSGQVVWGTYYGGGRDDGGNGISVDAAGLVTLVGSTASATLPGTNAGSLQPTQPCTVQSGALPCSFVAQFDPAADRIQYASFFGTPGTTYTALLAAAPDPLGGIVWAGAAQATVPFATNPHSGGWDITVARFNLLPAGAQRCALDSPTCGARLFTGVTAWPASGSTACALRCSGMPAAGTTPPSGALLVDVTASCGPLQPILGSHLLPFSLALPIPGAPTTITVPLPLATVPAGASASFQFAWINPAACSGALLSASNVLRVVVQ